MLKSIWNELLTTLIHRLIIWRTKPIEWEAKPLNLISKYTITRNNPWAQPEQRVIVPLDIDALKENPFPSFRFYYLTWTTSNSSAKAMVIILLSIKGTRLNGKRILCVTWTKAGGKNWIETWISFVLLLVVIGARKKSLLNENILFPDHFITAWLFFSADLTNIANSPSNLDVSN